MSRLEDTIGLRIACPCTATIQFLRTRPTNRDTSFSRLSIYNNIRTRVCTVSKYRAWFNLHTYIDGKRHKTQSPLRPREREKERGQEKKILEIRAVDHRQRGAAIFTMSSINNT